MTEETMEQPLQIDELATLKSRADVMGIKYHPSIGVDKLREKVQAHLDGTPLEDEEEAPQEETPALNASIPRPSSVAEKPAAPRPETKEEKRVRLNREGRRLIHVSITCMNPLKKEWQGEQFTFSNRNVGTVNRFVPFQRDWHVEAVILDMLREREFQTFSTRKKGPAGIEVKEHRMVREFAINVLEPLTPEELRQLAQRQKMADGAGEE